MSLSARPPPIITYNKTTNIYVLVTFCTDSFILLLQVIGGFLEVTLVCGNLLVGESAGNSNEPKRIVSLGPAMVGVAEVWAIQ